VSSTDTTPGVSFGVTVATSSIELDADRRGEAAFTVTNRTRAARRGRARIVVTGSADTGWLSLAGEPERDFMAGATHVFSVGVAVPAAAAQGTYAFRLDVVAVANPDEDYTEGPTVTFTVGAERPKPPPTLKRGYLASAVGAVIGTLVGGAIGLIPGALFTLFSLIALKHPPGLAAVVTVLGVGGLLFAWGGAAAGSWIALRLSGYIALEPTAAILLAAMFVPMLAMLIFLLVAGTSVNGLVVAIVMLVAAGGLGAGARAYVVQRLEK
jgi:hypothetical protein